MVLEGAGGKLHTKHIWRRQGEGHDFIQWRQDDKDLKKTVTGRLPLCRKTFNWPSWCSSRKKEKHSIQQKQLRTPPSPHRRCRQFHTLCLHGKTSLQNHILRCLRVCTYIQRWKPQCWSCLLSEFSPGDHIGKFRLSQPRRLRGSQLCCPEQLGGGPNGHPSDKTRSLSETTYKQTV